MKTVLRSHGNPIMGFVRTKVKVEQFLKILHLDQTTIVLFKNSFYEKH